MHQSLADLINRCQQAGVYLDQEGDTYTAPIGYMIQDDLGNIIKKFVVHPANEDYPAETVVFVGTEVWQVDTATFNLFKKEMVA